MRAPTITATDQQEEPLVLGLDFEIDHLPTTSQACFGLMMMRDGQSWNKRARADRV